MFVMELAEVVNPHFAVPVVGVVLCAVLVFAFGFKSPVQPPSFNFDEHEDRKSRKQKKTKKPQINGHIVSLETNAATLAKQPTTLKQSPGNKHSLEKPEQNKNKGKKGGNTPKQSPKAANVITAPLEDDDGGWTIALPRKEKKRSKKEEPSSRQEEGKALETLYKSEEMITETPAKVEVSVIPEVEPTELPKQQRPKKEKKAKQEVPVVQTEVPEKNSSPAVEIDISAQPDSDNKLPKDTIPEPVAQEVIPETDEKPSKPSPKKKKNKKPKISTGGGDGQKDIPSINTPDSSANLESITKEAISEEVMQKREENIIQKTTDVVHSKANLMGADASHTLKPTSTDAKIARSPKKKKNKGKNQSLGMGEATEVGPDESQATSSSSTVNQDLSFSSTENTQLSTKGAAKDRLSEAPSEPSVVKPATSESTASQPTDGANASQSTEKVTFDELGEWQEAKPVKKKKVPTATLR